MAVGLVFKQPGKNTHATFFPNLDDAVRAARDLAAHDRPSFVAVVKGNGEVVSRIREGGLHTLPPDPTLEELDPVGKEAEMEEQFEFEPGQLVRVRSDEPGMPGVGQRFTVKGVTRTSKGRVVVTVHDEDFITRSFYAEEVEAAPMTRKQKEAARRSRAKAQEAAPKKRTARRKA